MAAIQRPDVVLLDIQSPLIEIDQIARHFRFEFARKDLLIIAFAEPASCDRRELYDQAGVDLLLIKPIDPEVIETLLMLEYERFAQSSLSESSRE